MANESHHVVEGACASTFWLGREARTCTTLARTLRVVRVTRVDFHRPSSEPPLVPHRLHAKNPLASVGASCDRDRPCFIFYPATSNKKLGTSTARFIGFMTDVVTLGGRTPRVPYSSQRSPRRHLARRCNHTRRHAQFYTILLMKFEIKKWPM